MPATTRSGRRWPTASRWTISSRIRPTSLRLIALVVAAASLATGPAAEDAREIVRKSVERDQTNWLRMKDYTWVARSTERHFGSDGKGKTTERSAWKPVVRDGEPYRRMLERNGQPLPPAEQKKQQDKLDKSVAKLAHETPEEKRRRLAGHEMRRRREREFLRQIPEAFDFRI